MSQIKDIERFIEIPDDGEEVYHGDVLVEI